MFLWIFLWIRAGQMKQMRLPVVAPVRPRIVSTGDESARGLLEDLGWSWPQTREQAEPALSPGHSDCAGSAAGWEHKAAPSRCGVCASVSSLTRLQPSLGTARQL